MGMNGRICVVTGSNTGIGFWTARGLARQGATVVLACRDPAKGQAALDAIRRDSAQADVHLVRLDLASFRSVEECASRLLEKFPRIHVLVNNAGLMVMKRQTSADGHELTFAVNHLGPFLLTDLLLDRLKASAPARIVNVASNAHRGGTLRWDDLQSERSYSGNKAYSQSKLCNILFTWELARRLDATGVTANCLHPGVIASEFFRDLPRLIGTPLGWFLSSPEEGARPAIHLASSKDLEGVSRKYFDKMRQADPIPEAQDPEAARRLWDLSAHLTGLAPA